jgi:hypothetical protein
MSQLNRNRDEWYKNMIAAKKADVVLSIDRDTREITIHSGCSGWKYEQLWDIIRDFDNPSLVGLSFEKANTPDTFVIEVNACWDIDKLYLQILERIKLEVYEVDLELQDTSVSPA